MTDLFPPNPTDDIWQHRAHAIAAQLFPNEATDGHDCRAQYDRMGEPCLVCADRNEAWTARVMELTDLLRKTCGG